jgi:hypothetical protein
MSSYPLIAAMIKVARTHSSNSGSKAEYVRAPPRSVNTVPRTQASLNAQFVGVEMNFGILGD